VSSTAAHCERGRTRQVDAAKEPQIDNPRLSGRIGLEAGRHSSRPGMRMAKAAGADAEQIHGRPDGERAIAMPELHNVNRWCLPDGLESPRAYGCGCCRSV